MKLFCLLSQNNSISFIIDSTSNICPRNKSAILVFEFICPSVIKYPIIRANASVFINSSRVFVSSILVPN